MKSHEHWYRYTDFLIDTDPICVSIELKTYLVIRHTPKGVWIDTRFDLAEKSRKKFILKDAMKRFACPTIEEAKESFLARKRKQLRIYKARTKQVEQVIIKATDQWKDK